MKTNRVLYFDKFREKGYPQDLVVKVFNRYLTGGLARQNGW